MLFPIRIWMALALSVFALANSAQAQNGYDRRGGDYLRFRNSQRRPGGLRDALRAGLALPRLELFLSANGKCDRDLLVEEPRGAARRGQMLRLRRSRRRRRRAAQGADRIFHRPAWRRLSQFRRCDRFGRRGLQGGLRGGEQMPRLDLCAAGLHFADGALLSQGQDHAAAAKAVLHFGRGALAALSGRR